MFSLKYLVHILLNYFLQIDVPFPKIRLLALARTLTCFKLDDDKVHISDGNLNCNMNKLPERKLNQQCKQNIGWEKFKDVFMVSALTGSGIKDIKVCNLNNYYYYRCV